MYKLKVGQNLVTKLVTILFNIFLLEVDFDKSTIRLHLVLISSIFTKFLENKRSIVMLSINCKFL